jgi:hypothetical protein
MIKSPFGLTLATESLLLALSPEARKTVRKLSIKATETALDLSEKTKEATESLKKHEISSLPLEHA